MLTISACVIVKNEEENLPKWLESMKKFADELIVVDTGSTDKSVEIAQDAGAKIYHFNWIDDFSAAKNYAIEQAGGKWLTFLDADEYFAPADAGKVRNCAERYDKDQEVAGVLFRRINIEKASGQDMGTADYKPLLFRNVPWIRYCGSIHETVYNLDRSKKQRMEYVPGITVYHTGYSVEVMQDKAKRDLRMLLERQKRGEEQPLDNFHLMDCYYSLKDYDRAEIFAEQALASGQKPVGQEKRPYTVLIQSRMLAGKSNAVVIEAAERAIHDYPQAAEFWMLWGVQDWRRKDYLIAADHLQKGYELCQKEEGSAALLFLPLVCEYLGQIALWQHHTALAVQYFSEGLQQTPRNLALLHKLCEALEGEDSVSVIACLNHLYDKQADSAFLVRALVSTKQAEACLYYDHFAGGILETGQRYLKAGRPQAAAAMLIQRLDSLDVLGSLVRQSCTAKEAGMLDVLLPSVYRRLFMDGTGQEQESAVLDEQYRRREKKLQRIRKYFSL